MLDLVIDFSHLFLNSYMLYHVKIDREIKLMTKRFALVLLVVVGVGATWAYFYFGTGHAGKRH